MTEKLKVLFTLDYIKQHYVRMVDGKLKTVYFDTAEGKQLKRMLNEAFAKNEVTGSVEYHIAYAYKAIPRILKENTRDPSRAIYKAPGQKDYTAHKETYLQDIRDYDPDIIVPVGGAALKPLRGRNSMKAFRGVPEKVAVLDKEYWTLPTYSIQYMWVEPGVEKFIRSDLDMLGDFLAHGEVAFQAKETHYTPIYNDLKAVSDVFVEAFKHGKTPDDAIAWDYETNNTYPFRHGAKIISMSISTKAGTGITFPVNHRDYPWTEDEQKIINNLIVSFIEAPLYKVGHNISFDIRQTKAIINRDLIARKQLDTKTAYFLTVSQELRDDFGLKTLAYQYTDIGGYEQPLDDFKLWFKGGKDCFLAKVQKELKGKYELTDDDYLDSLTDGEKKKLYQLAIELLGKYEKYSSVKNPIDGGNFNYEWIPYRILATYASGDADVTRRINEKIYLGSIKGTGKLEKLYIEHYPELIDVLTRIENVGLQLNTKRLGELSDFFLKKQAELYDEIIKEDSVKKVAEFKEKQYLIGLEEKAKKPAERDKDKYKLYTKYKNEEDRKFSPNSNYDMSMALFGMTGYRLPVEREFLPKKVVEALRNKEITEDDVSWSDFSTNAAAIERLLYDHPDFKTATLLSEYKKYEKLRSSFTKQYLDLMDDNEVLHTKFNETGTVTTRLSSSGPNL